MTSTTAVRRAPRNRAPRSSSADPVASDELDRTLARAAFSAMAAGLVLPPILMVTTDVVKTGDLHGYATLELTLASPCAPAPEPWESSADGTVWRCDQRGLAGLPGGRTPALALVVVQSIGTRRTLIDLAAANGLIWLTGARESQLEVCRRWSEQLAGAPWSSDSPVTAVDLAELGVANEELTPQLCDRIGSGAAGITFVNEFPRGEIGMRLRAAGESPLNRWVVVALSGVARARWEFTAQPDGSVKSPVFPRLGHATELSR